MRSIPVVILGGSDRKPAHLPASGAKLHPLVEYKGAALQVRGRPLIAHLVQRLNAAEAFGPVTITGPARVYGSLGLEAKVLDSDGSVATNLRASIEHCAPADGPMAVLACDVLPTAGEFTDLRRQYEVASHNVWLPFVRKPDDPTRLGVFAWKPTYPVIPASNGEPVDILPGHLCIFEPRSLRLPLLYRLMDAAYRTRNRRIGTKLAGLLSTALLGLLAIDARRLTRLRAPDRTVTTVASGLRLVRGLRASRLHIEELQHIVEQILLRERVWDGPPEECVSFPVVNMLSLAEDVDTEEEARVLEDQ